MLQNVKDVMIRMVFIQMENPVENWALFFYMCLHFKLVLHFKLFNKI